MKRDAYQDLLKWKESSRRKPLLVKGARQTGKTYLIKEFGKSEYSQLWYFNFEEDPELETLFEHTLSPEMIVPKLSRWIGQPIVSEETLIVFDEIQEAPRALTSLKYFYENAPEYHVIAAGSLLGVKLADVSSFPVAKVNFLDLFPMSFFEFLEAIDETALRERLEEAEEIDAFPGKYHQKSIELLKLYYFLGGMPEVIDEYRKHSDHAICREVHHEIIRSYELDFAKHAKAVDVPKISLIWKSLHSQLAKENKKFIFTALKQSARGREYESAIQWMLDAGIIQQCTNIKTAKFPLSGYEESSIFKLYFSDVGLLGAMSGLSPEILMMGHRCFEEFHGAFVENYVAQQLKTLKPQSLHYWTSLGKTAEVDFLWEPENDIFPLEVKAGINTQSKSLKSFQQQFSPRLLLRASLLNLEHNGNMLNIPLYAIESLPKLTRGILAPPV